MAARVLQTYGEIYEALNSSNADEESKLASSEAKKPKHLQGDDYCNVHRHPNEFKYYYGVTKVIFEFILETIGEDLAVQVDNRPAISSQKQLMIALWKLATSDSFEAICNRFDVEYADGVEVVIRVIRALTKQSRIFIQWPTGNQVSEVMKNFERSSGGFPKIIGTITRTHIRIEIPKENSENYINSKGYYSVQLQLVCDHKALLTHCSAGHPGSLDSQAILQKTNVAYFFQNVKYFPLDSLIVGDSTYEMHNHLRTPYQDTGNLNKIQKTYNRRLTAANMIGKKCVGQLKCRMKSLFHCLPEFIEDFMGEYIMACCVIHNICKLQNDEIDIATVFLPNVPDQNNHAAEEQNLRINSMDTIVISDSWEYSENDMN